MKHIIFLILLSINIFSNPSLAHEWYDPYCCNDKDCKSMELWKGSIKITNKGYLVTIKSHQYLVLFGDKRIKPSQDNDYHACIISEDTITDTAYFSVEGMVVRCLYIPVLS